MSSYSRAWAHSLEKEHQTVAERSKTTPNRCRAAQNDTKSLQNCAKRPKINAERTLILCSYTGPSVSPSVLRAKKNPRVRWEPKLCKKTPNSCRTQQNDPKITQNAAKRHKTNAELSFSREWAHNLVHELILWKIDTKQLQKEERYTQSLQNAHNDTKTLPNGAKRHQNIAERSKTTPNEYRTLIL